MSAARRAYGWRQLGLWLLSACVALFGCAAAAGGRSGTAPAPSASAAAASPPANELAVNQDPARPGFGDEDCSVPVSVRDPQWGKSTALVTLVVFGDLRAASDRRPTLQRVQEAYGPDAVRLVWKHAPAASSPESLAAAQAAVTVFSLNGSQAFWRFRERVLASQRAPTSEDLLAWAIEAGVDPVVYATAVRLSGVSRKVEEDLQLARQLGLQVTPVYFVNGELVHGAAPFEVLQRSIDRQLQEARALLSSGTRATELYATLTNQHRPRPPADPGSAVLDAQYIEASHILVQYAGARRAPYSITRSKTEARKLIEEVLAKLRAGADFAQLAAQYSDEPGAATRRGALGRFRKGMMVKPFEEAAFALKIGELSGVVETDFGFHVIKRTN